MKKLIALTTIVLACSMTTLFAQGGGGGQQMTPEQRAAMMKERYKGMGCNDVQADSLIAINNDMRPQMMALRDMDEATRAVKMKELTDARNKRIEKALPADLAKKVIEQMSQQRPPGGGGGRGNQ
ncbi:MAG: hypothetical protein RLZZ28_233 [Bacteroidota bacterium]